MDHTWIIFCLWCSPWFGRWWTYHRLTIRSMLILPIHRLIYRWCTHSFISLSAHVYVYVQKVSAPENNSSQKQNTLTRKWQGASIELTPRLAATGSIKSAGEAGGESFLPDKWSGTGVYLTDYRLALCQCDSIPALHLLRVQSHLPPWVP